MTEEYIKKDDVLKAIPEYIGMRLGEIRDAFNTIPTYTFPDAPKEPSLQEMIDKIFKSSMSEIPTNSGAKTLRDEFAMAALLGIMSDARYMDCINRASGAAKP